MKTKLEIIDETINYFNLGNRAVDAGGACKYVTRQGRNCAVGRCMVAPDPYMWGCARLISINGIRVNLESTLKPEYQGHSVKFWVDLQALHDNRSYWNEAGLSNYGVVEVEKLKKLYKE